jgi:hypothetical protein
MYHSKLADVFQIQQTVACTTPNWQKCSRYNRLLHVPLQTGRRVPDTTDDQVNIITLDTKQNVTPLKSILVLLPGPKLQLTAETFYGYTKKSYI